MKSQCSPSRGYHNALVLYIMLMLTIGMLPASGHAASGVLVNGDTVEIIWLSPTGILDHESAVLLANLLIESMQNGTPPPMVIPPPKMPRRAGDIVARDLSIPGLGWAGHVGMIDDNGKVVEVLNKKNVVQKNSMTKFLSQSEYWGARFSKDPVFRDRGKHMAKMGWLQSNFSPQYTITSSYRIGSYEKKCTQTENPFTSSASDGSGIRCIKWDYVFTPGMWRCDTFVNYMYKTQSGKDFPVIMTPRAIYNFMPKER